MTLLSTFALILAAVISYEILRFVVLRAIRRRLRDSTKSFVRRHEVRLDRFKFTRRSFIKNELLADPVLAAEIGEEARRRGVSPGRLHDTVEGWLDEIIPGFSILSYYELGMGVTRFVVNLVYDVIVDREEIARVRRSIPEDAVVLYLMNHRSNFDYLLVGYLLARSVALSYAVGEWARVWPLEHLFRSFGSYFVRRGEKDPLYHKVLRRYVQVVSRYGITQGVFPEGGLSRDGRLRPPKTGLLTYVAELVADPEFEKDILFVPVAIGYDTVLEDRVLVRESLGAARAPSFWEKARSALVFVGRAPFVLVANGLRVLTGRVKRNGYATAAFGEPISLRAWLAARDIDFAALDERSRRGRIGELARDVMGAIGAVVPVTPVPLVCWALLRVSPEGEGEADVPYPALVAEVGRLREALRAAGARLVTGEELRAAESERRALEAERGTRTAGLYALEEQIVAGSQAEQTCELGVGHLRRRGLIEVRGGAVRLRAEDRPVIAYYAHAVDGLLVD